MGKYKVGDKVYVPYGRGDSGTIVDIKHFLLFPYYVIHSDSYKTFDVIYKYSGLAISRKQS